MTFTDLLGKPGFPQDCFEQCRNSVCVLSGCMRMDRPTQTNTLQSHEIARQARERRERDNQSRQVKRRLARKGAA
jgi:hypothetical protein